MKIQSLSVVVPNKQCINNCPFCVSRMVDSNQYENKMDINHPRYDKNVKTYLEKLRFVADNGCQTLMLTGTSEPQQNKPFLATFSLLHQLLGNPFSNIEMQTTGIMLQGNKNYLRFLRNFVGVDTIAISVNSISDQVNNTILNNGNPSLAISLESLCADLKEYDFNIRVCCNLTSLFDVGHLPVEQIFKYLKEKCLADQVTFRKLFVSAAETPQSDWIREHAVDLKDIRAIQDFLKEHPIIGKTVYGTCRYDVDGMSVIYDVDCMGKNPETDVNKYLILRPDCHLYSQWDSKASMVF